VRRWSAGSVFVVLVALLFAGPAEAATGPLFDVEATWGPTHLPPGGKGLFTLQVRNIGDEVAAKKLFISDELPAGVEVTSISWRSAVGDVELTNLCSTSETGPGTETVNCEVPAASTPAVAPPPGQKASAGIINPEQSGYLLPIFIEVAINPGANGTGTNVASVAGGGSPTFLTDEGQVSFSGTPSPFGIVPGSVLADVFKAPYPDMVASRTAGDHPFEQRVEFDLTATSVDSPFDGTLETPSNGSLRSAEVTLPRGLVGNPEALPKCNAVQFAQVGVTNNATRCPANTQVGYIDISALGGEGNHGNGNQTLMPGVSALLSRVPIYNLKPPTGTLVDLAFSAQTGLVISHIYATLDPSRRYAIKAISPNISTAAAVRGAKVTLWGVPGDPTHDKYRYFSGDPANNPEKLGLGAPFAGPIRPFFTNPMDCNEENGSVSIRIDSYEHPGEFSASQGHPDPLNVVGCEDSRFHFEPQIALQPTNRHASAPTGLSMHFQVPQGSDEAQSAKELYAENGAVKGIATPPIKKVVVTLPEGMTLNPSAANGLGSCTSAQIGLESSSPVACPDNSQFGTLILRSPNLPANAQPEGRIYVAKQSDNPFHSFLALYLVIEDADLGLLVKVAGKVDLDPTDGQITTTFDELPQFPVSDMQVNLKGGVRAGLVEPSTCGAKTITAEFFTWQDPASSHVVKNSYEVAETPEGLPCVRSLSERLFRPAIEAGTVNATAGEYSPFALRLRRTDQDQEISKLGLKMPKGLTGKLAGIGECTEADIARASARTAVGEGAFEERNPSCPSSSLVGKTDVGAGAGVLLTYVPGNVYLGGPYDGAPLSIVAVTPAVVGPFDLGVITVRTALRIDSATAQVSVASDPFPQIFQGIPVRIRDIRLNLNRHDFVLNPTSCAEKQIEAHVTGTGGDVSSPADDTMADLFNRFQAVECTSLGFKPRLAFRLIGGTKRGKHPKLHAMVTYPKRGAYSNIARASVALPASEFLDQGHIGTVCTRVQFAAERCPVASVYGHAVAKSPLFDFPLEGPVYLRSSRHKLPDVVAALKGPAWMPIEIELAGRVDSINGGIRNTFEVVPDAPVESFRLTLAGGKKGLLVNSTDICVKPNRATAKFKAHNGRRIVLHPALVAASCSNGGHRKHRSRPVTD
jgi:hypothetical protein